MKKGYILKRLLRSVISVLIIMVVVFTLVYTLVPRDNIFFEDSTYRKLGGKPDDKTEYVYNTWEKLGYLDFVKINDYSLELYEAGSEELKNSLRPDSKETADFVALYSAKGYTIDYFKISGQAYAYKDIPIIQRLWKWFSNLIQVDSIYRVQDPNNPDLERKVYFGNTPTGGLALIGSGGYTPEDVRDVMSIMESRRWDIESLITQEYPWEKLEEAIQMAGRTDQALNVLIRY